MTVPHIPEDAFHHATDRIGRLLAVIPPGSSEEEVQEATSNFYRALGLEGECDSRALGLTRVVMAHLRRIEPDDVPEHDVSGGVLGIMLGLLLAQGTGWDPPLRES
jgi:hypothetical protein